LAYRLTLCTKQSNFSLEVLEVVEGSIDGSKTKVGNLIEFPEWAENRKAHLHGWDLGLTGSPNRVLNLLR
jgi:hypothetical protein